MAYTGMLENEPGPGEPLADTEEVATPEGAGEVDKVNGFVTMDVFPHTPKIGDTCTFRVADIAENGEVEIEYVTSEKSRPAPGAEPTPPWERVSQSQADEMLES